MLKECFVLSLCIKQRSLNFDGVCYTKLRALGFVFGTKKCNCRMFGR